MRKKYPELNSEQEIKHQLTSMGIDIFEPTNSRFEQSIAQSFEDFSNFVLHQEKDACLAILENDLQRDNNGDGGRPSSVGELQGGSDEYSIYRVSFPTEDDDDDDGYGDSGHDDDGRDNDNNNSDNAALQLLKYYNIQTRQTSKSALTIDKIERYMLGMCDRRSKKRSSFNDDNDYDDDDDDNDDASEINYTSLGNRMFIMQFGGPTEGQVRHIDNMVPNVQICTYMSSRCPSTIVYAVDDNGEDGLSLPVTDGASLIQFWERQHQHQPKQQQPQKVPYLLKQTLLLHGHTKLKSKWYTKYFVHWNTLNTQLSCFGKLYQPVTHQLGLHTTKPGTTLLAGGNEIHAGPPTCESRMFAFAIGIPEEKGGSMNMIGRNADGDDGDDNGDGEDEEEVNDGEVQYSPVLLHIDFCCLLFSIFDHDHYPREHATENRRNANEDSFSVAKEEEEVRTAKYFLVNVLIDLIRDYPMREYLVQIDEERVGVRRWLEEILTVMEEEGRRGSSSSVLDDLVDEAVGSDEILYSPDVVKRRLKKKRRKVRSSKAKVK